MISAILLSAGTNNRFGSPKALAKLGDESVIDRLLKALIAADIDEIIVVLGSGADQIKPHLFKHKNIHTVYNKDYNLGQTSSFKIGLTAVSPQATGILLLPVDYPLIREYTLTQLVAYFKENNPTILIPTYQDHKGHPPIFSNRLKEELLALDNGEGINTLIHRHLNETSLLPLHDAGVIQSFNTQEEFERLKRIVS